MEAIIQTMDLTQRERDALWAGLRLLQASLDRAPGAYLVMPDDGDIGDILTCSGDHAGMTADEIETFIEDKFECFPA